MYLSDVIDRILESLERLINTITGFKFFLLKHYYLVSEKVSLQCRYFGCNSVLNKEDI